MIRTLLIVTVVVAALDSALAIQWEDKVKEYQKNHTTQIFLFRVESPKGPKSIKTYEEAEELCKKEGATLAPNWRLRDFVQKRNYEKCSGCGWLLRSGSGSRFYYKNHRPICGKAEAKENVYYIKCADDPKDEGMEGYDAYCYGKSGPELPPDSVFINMEEDVGYVFVLRDGEDDVIETKSLATTLCRSRGAEIASSKQVELAYYNGMSVCACGWMENYSAMPMRDKIPSCGDSASYIGCPFGMLKNAYCFVDARQEPRGINLIDISKLGPNTFPVGIEPGAVQIKGGYVYTTQNTKGPESTEDVSQAFLTCKFLGSEMATLDQLKQARANGKQDCLCGYTWEHVLELVQGHLIKGGEVYKVCKDGVKRCDQVQESDIHCFKQCPYFCPPSSAWNIPVNSVKIRGGRVFHLEGAKGKYTISKTEAKKECKERYKNAAVATRDQLKAAQENGLTACRCGYLADGKVAFPMYRPIDGCGGDVGVFECPGDYSDIPEKGPKWDVYCFISDKELSKKSKFDEKFADSTKTPRKQTNMEMKKIDFDRGSKPKEGYHKKEGESLLQQHKAALRAQQG